MSEAALRAGAGALSAILVALPVAWAVWAAQSAVWLVAGLVVAAVALGGAAVAAGPWWQAMAADAAIVLPAVALAGTARLRRLPRASLAIAAVSGLGPAARFFRLVAPLLVPGVLAGGLLAFASLLAAAVAPAVLLPLVALAACLMAVLQR